MRGKRGLLAALLVIVLWTLSGCGAQQGRTLKVGVKDDVANFGLYDEESGRYSGLEIDLAELLCEELGYSGLELTTVSAATREAMIEDGTVDMIIATYSITPERMEAFDFSASYYTDQTAIMVEKSSLIADATELRGARIGVLRNSSAAQSLAEYLARIGLTGAEGTGDEVVFIEMDSYDDMAQALEVGDVDAIVADYSILSGYRDDSRAFLPDQFSSEEFGVCTKKNAALSRRVDEAIRRWLEDGTLARLKLKWGV